MKWRWLYVIKNRRNHYWNREGRYFHPSIHRASIYSKPIPAKVLEPARKVDFTAYEAKGTFEISEVA